MNCGTGQVGVGRMRSLIETYCESTFERWYLMSKLEGKAKYAVVMPGIKSTSTDCPIVKVSVSSSRSILSKVKKKSPFSGAGGENGKNSSAVIDLHLGYLQAYTLFSISYPALTNTSNI